MSAQRKATGPTRLAARRTPDQPEGRQPARRAGRSGSSCGVCSRCSAGFLLGCAAFAYGYVATDIPDPNKDFEAQTTVVYYADGTT